MKDNDIDFAINYLKKEIRKYPVPIVTEWANRKKSPFHVLISCVLSLRTKDETTRDASNRLFAKAETPKDMLRLSEEEIQKLIYPVGFYKNKSNHILEICKMLINDFNGKVPNNIEDLLKLKGVGRKTANLVVTLGYNKPGICVDIHVHRISNRLGYVNTKNADKTEFALRDKLPKKYWIIYNDLLVTFGQHVCKPVSPWCSKCGLIGVCERRNVDKSR